jgi:hypothetical protein
VLGLAGVFDEPVAVGVAVAFDPLQCAIGVRKLFLRELRGVWLGAYPPLDVRVAAAADTSGWPAPGPG